MYMPNAIAWSQWRLLGGGKRIFSIVFAYAALLPVVVLGFRYIIREPHLASFCHGALMALAAVQSLLLLGGCNSIYRAINRDATTGMLESHRLSPMRALYVVVGYVVGPLLQILGLFVVGIIAGVVLIRIGITGIDLWLLGNAYLLGVAIMAWTATVYLALVGKKPFNPSVVLLVLFLSSALLMMVPAAGLATGVYAGVIAYRMMTGVDFLPGYATACVYWVMVVMTLIWGGGAVRKFRRPDWPAFGTVRAIGLLAIWLGISVLGAALLDSDDVRDAANIFRDFPADVLMLVTMIASILVAIVAVVSAVDARFVAMRDSGPRYRGDRAPKILVPLLAALMITAFTAHIDAVLEWQSLLQVFIAVAATMVAIEGFVAVGRARGVRVPPLLVLFLILIIGAPPLLDAWRADYLAYSAYNAGVIGVRAQESYFSGASPAGTIMNHLGMINIDPYPGIGFLCVLALSTQAFGFWAQKRHQTALRNKQ
jgi:hypothetical protein